MSHSFDVLAEELQNHYDPVDNDEGWYRCIHCRQKIYYHPHKPEDLAQHIPDEIYWTSDDQDGCPDRLNAVQRE